MTASAARILATDDNHQSSPLSPHLKALENEAIHIFREVAAEFERPVMLYSVGKDSSVLLHVARKAFYPEPVPFPLLHVDTGWKFSQMIAFRDRTAKELGLDLHVHTNPRGAAENLSPFAHGSSYFTDVMKTEALRQALDAARYDAAFGGARRDEDASRSKERIFSFRTPEHRWDARNQRPELWNLYNGRIRKGESVRVFPLSNWTELDVWHYIKAESIPIVDLYFAKRRPFVQRDGMIILAEDERLELWPGEVKQEGMIRFRTLGCFALSGGIRSEATTIDDIITEITTSTVSERQGRAIDRDEAGSMEKKKLEGYF
ncbi:sulfate adenylyltransferase subunit CysD [Aliihoeflea sp. PC F10.4]